MGAKLTCSIRATIVAIMVLSVFAGQSFAAPTDLDLNITITADNAYAVFTGDKTGVSSLVGWAENFTLLGLGIWTAESYAVTVPDKSYLYVVAWSDYSVLQGLLVDVEISPIMEEVLSGDPAWKVTATCTDCSSAMRTPPSTSDVTDEIILANAGLSGSGGWVDITQSSMKNGDGSILDPGGNLIISGIDLDSHWMWYDSGLSSGPFAPFRPGFNHCEYLIFSMQVPEPATVCLLALGGLALLRKRRA